MYGYIKPRTDDLLVRELSLYHAARCGLCRAMRRKTGLLSALSLRYDFVFLALCRMLAMGQDVTVRYRRCPLHPFGRRAMLEENEALLYAAAASAVVAYLKKEDDITDRGLLARIRALLTLLPAAAACRRAGLSELEERLRDPLLRLADYERRSLASVDLPAEEAGVLLGEVFGASCRGEGRGTLYRIGYSLGRLIYLIDALDDLEDDRKKQNYNPYLLLYGDDEEALLEDAEVGLTLECAALAEAIEALPPGGEEELLAIVRNIVYWGIPDRCREVIGKWRKGEER